MPQLDRPGAGEAWLAVGAEPGWQQRPTQRPVQAAVVVVVLQHAVVVQELLVQVQRTHEALLVMVAVMRVRDGRVVVSGMEVGVMRVVR